MQIISGIKEIKKYKRPVVALGIFDGVHLAHRRILKETVRKARLIKGRSVVVTFWPHPQKKESLYSLEHRLKLIKELNIDVCIVLKFTRALSLIPAEKFVKNILAGRIGARHVYVGKNFRFGRSARGDFKYLTELSAKYNFKVKIFDLVKIKHCPVSSTYIRRLIMAGKIDTAEKLLFRPVSILGTVVKGASLAKSFGFPTANINPHHEVIPPSGVYMVKVVFRKKEFKGICYIGKKPTILKQDQKANRGGLKHIEVHIFSFNKNIYKNDLEIQFIDKIRDEKKFASRELLIDQIKKDVVRVKKSFSLQ